MDEGTYGNIYQRGRNASPLTPNIPSSSAYQTNLNRTKTRKWVEAKVQSYDGDDWGNDYDDDEPEEAQVPQPPIPQAGARVFSQPTAASGYSMGDTSTPRSPSGPPALQIQTQQPMSANAPTTDFVSDPSTLSSASERGLGERLVSPQSASSHAYPSRPEYRPVVTSPTSQDRGGSPAAPDPRFPPRKSSITQHDFPDLSEGSRNSRPASSSSARPWMEQRSNSPGQSTGTGTPTSKPLPFVRPADIYRRMEEEKEKERRSMDSGRPSMDSIDSAGGMRSSTEQRRRTSLDRDDGSDPSRTLRPTLAPVAERRSEYGLDRLVGNASKSDQEVATMVKDPSPATGTTAPVSQPESGPLRQEEEESDEQRHATSPRLPDLARMSGFGDDLFSSHTPATHGAASTSTNGGAFEKDSKPQYSLEPQSFGSTPRNVSPAPSSTQTKGAGLVTPDPSSVVKPTESANFEQPTAVKASELANVSTASSSDRSQSPPKPVQEQPRPSRPSLPGGWVSESTTFGSPGITPMERPEFQPSRLSQVQDAGEVSPVSPISDSDEEPSDIKPTTTFENGQSTNDTPKAVAEVQAGHDASRNGFGVSTGKQDQAVTINAVSTEPTHHATPQSLPPLQTANPKSTVNLPPVIQTVAANLGEVKSAIASSRDSPSDYSAGTRSRTATGASEFAPTAPLNPHHGDVKPLDFNAPSMLPRHATMSSVDTSSPNETDRLREDIIKSLSPVHSPPSVGPFLAPREKDIPKMPRESRYLSGVYDDYLGASEGKSLQQTGQALKDETNVNRSRPPTSVPAQASAPLQPHQQSSQQRTPSPDAAISAPQATAAQPPLLTRRFSWEQGPEEVTLSSVEEPTTQALGAETSRGEGKSPVSGESTPAGQHVQPSTPAPALHIDTENTGSMSHQVSQVSSRAPGGLGTAALHPPSPVSVMSTEKIPAELVPSAPTNEDRRMSLAEEKVPFQASSSHPVSPSPPQDDHTALSGSQPDSSSTPTGPPQAASTFQPKIMTWREILSYPSSDLRVQKFDEAREQFYSMESGLSNWIMNIQNQPEHAMAPRSELVADNMQAQSSPTGTQQSTQQPYYQQYLNASNSNLAASPPNPGRASAGNLLSMGHPPQQPSSGFGHSGNQVGAKSKEFLHAAGVFGNKATKSGMKLFNKGKNKLRNTGDKDSDPDSVPLSKAPKSPYSAASHPGRLRNERRRSWGISALGGPNSAGKQAPHQHSQSLSLSLIHPPNRTSTRSKSFWDSRWGKDTLSSSLSPGNPPSPPPQLPLPPRVSPFSSVSHGLHHSSPWEQSSSDTNTADSTAKFAGGKRRVPDPSASDRFSSPQPELVCPISETRSSTPVLLNVAKRDEHHQPYPRSPDHQLHPCAAPFVKEEKKGTFGVALPAQPHSSAHSRFSAAPSATPSHHVAHLTTDDRSDSWVQVTSQPSSASAPNNNISVVPIGHTHHQMTASMAADRPIPSSMPTDHYAAQHDAGGNSAPQLPPIRRTSTFGIGRKNKGQADDGDNPMPSPLATSEDGIPPVPAVPSAMDQPGVIDHQMKINTAQWPRYPGPGPVANGQNFSPSIQQTPDGFRADQNSSPHQQQPSFSMMGRGGPPPGGPQPYFNASPGQAGSPPLQGQPSVPPGIPSPQGNPINRFPPQGMWKLEETRLTEPLRSPRSRASSNSLNQQPGYYAYDKETDVPPTNPGGSSAQRAENAGPSPSSSMVPTNRTPGYYAYDKENDVDPPSASSRSAPAPIPSPVQRIGRNSGNPPVAASRFPELFPSGGSNQPLSHMLPAQQNMSEQPPFPRQDNMGISKTSTQGPQHERRGTGFNSGLLKDISGKFMNRGRNNSMSDVPGSVRSDDVSEISVVTNDYRKKDKRGSLLALGSQVGSSDTPAHSTERKVDDHPLHHNPQQLATINKANTFFGAMNFNQNAALPTPPMKKRFSDFKGFFKGGSGDEPRDDQPVKPTTAHSSRPSMQGLPRQGPQGPHNHQGPPGQARVMGPPSPNRGRTSTQGSAQPPSLADLQRDEEQRGRKGPSGPGAFLSGLFKDRSSSKPREPKPQPGQNPPMRGPPGGLVQGQRPGMLGPQGAPVHQQLGPPGQPGQPGPFMSQPPAMSGQGGVMMAKQQLPPPNGAPMQSQAGGPSPQQSSPLRPVLPPQQRSQSDTKPDEHQARGPLSSNPITPSPKPVEQNLAPGSRTDSPQPSQHSSQDRLSAAGSSIAPGTVPARKPVGSGSSRVVSSSSMQNIAPSPVSQPATDAPKVDSEISEDNGTIAEPEADENAARRSGATSVVPKSPQLAAPPVPGHTRQSSLPTPTQSPPPQSSSPGRLSHQRLSAQSAQPPASPRAQISPHSPPQGNMVSPAKPVSAQTLEPPQWQPGARLPGQPSLSPDATPQQSPRSQWSIVVNASQHGGPQPSPTGQQQVPQQVQGQWRPTPAPQEHHKSGISKFFGAFKMGSKQPGPNQPQQQQPRPGQQMPPNSMQAGRGQIPGQPMPLGMQPGMQRPPMGSGGPPPSGQFDPAPGQRQGPIQPGQGRGQMPPQQMPLGRGHVLPSMQVGRSQMPHYMVAGPQGGRGQVPQQQPQPQVRQQEKQYDQVPIPRGYEAVHGYGNASMMAPSLYNVGRGSPMASPMVYGQQQQPQYPPMMPQQAQPPYGLPQPQMHTPIQMQPHTQPGTPVNMMQHPQSQAPPQPPNPARMVPHPQLQPPSQSGAPVNMQPHPTTQQNTTVQPPTTQSPPPQTQFHPQGHNSSPPPGMDQDFLALSNASSHPQVQRGNQSIFVPPPASILSSTPEPASRANSVVPRGEEAPKPQPQPHQIDTTMNVPPGQTQIHHLGSPEGYPLPDSAATFSPVNSAANRLPNPPLPPVEKVQVHQGLPSNESATPSPSPRLLAALPAPHRNVSSISAMDEPPRSNSLSPEGIPRRTFSVSPEPPGPSPPSINTERANTHSPEEDDIYSATPRKSQAPPAIQQTAHQPEPKSVLRDHEQTAGAAVSANGNGNAHPTPMEPEEKILVDQPVELAAINDNDDLLDMRATSYPGQEWNPYGYSEFSGDSD